MTERGEPLGPCWYTQSENQVVRSTLRACTHQSRTSTSRGQRSTMAARTSAAPSTLLVAAWRASSEIGRAHVCTPVTNALLVCRLLLEKTHMNNRTVIITSLTNLTITLLYS